ncbi:hypothetical protein EZV62_020225 [Acer yangbiense]|uniref:Uncharacterized protein n=1 Tax=Acer yangbiense TaxID=1000413 RepID=A0A5C7HDN5_9ROSI|nr:hypothetical protein EZV62_020225 [Acer yangbiense]
MKMKMVVDGLLLGGSPCRREARGCGGGESGGGQWKRSAALCVADVDAQPASPSPSSLHADADLGSQLSWMSCWIKLDEVSKFNWLPVEVKAAHSLQEKFLTIPDPSSFSLLLHSKEALKSAQREMEVAKSTPASPPPPPPPQTHAPGIKNNKCFICDQQGHWARDCPNKSQPKATGAAVDGLQKPIIQCPCGGGACAIRISRTEKNPGRKFYACPVPGTSDCNFFKWCDKVKDDDIKSCPQSKFPKCACGAGMCRKLKGSSGRSYFVCRIKTGHGACRFFQPENTSENTGVGEHVDESKDYGSSQSTCDSHPSLERSEMMEIEVENPQGFPSMVSMPIPSAEDDTQQMEGRIYDQTSDISSPNHHDPSPYVAPENGSPTLESTIGDIVMQEAESLNSKTKKTKKTSRGISLTSQNKVHCRQIEFWRQISAAKDISTGGLHELGWLGRLVFHPPRSLKDHPPKPFFCGIFPNYDPIFVPEDGNMLNAESDKLSSPTPGAGRQFWNGVLSKPSGLEGSFATTQKSLECTVATPIQSLEQAAVQFQKTLEQAALHFQNEFVANLNRIDPSDPDTMTKEADNFFSYLDRVQLPIDYKPFSRRVREFIESALRLAGIEKSICEDCSLEELTEIYNGKKVRFDDISNAHDEAVAAFANSSQRHQSLQEEASRLRDMLLLIESQSSCCEAETSELKIRVDAICKVKLESKKRMEEAKEMLKFREQREEERCAAKAALEQARIQLQQ